MGVLLNGAVDPHRIRQQMKDVIELETRIAQITVSSAERRDEEKLYHALTIADLRNLAPFVSFFFLLLKFMTLFSRERVINFVYQQLDWDAYFQSAFSQVNISLTPTHPVVMTAPSISGRHVH